MAANLRIPVGWDFFLKWSAVTALGWSVWVLLVPMALLVSFFSLASPAIASVVVAAMLVNMTPGMSVGLFQWLFLRQHIRRASLWLISSILGSVLGAMILTNSYITARGQQGTVIGMSIGAMQWLVLSRWRWRSLLWPLVSAFSWALSWQLLFDSLYANTVRQAWDGALGATLAAILASSVIPGIALGSMTGLTLMWLLRKRARQSKSAH